MTSYKLNILFFCFLLFSETFAQVTPDDPLFPEQISFYYPGGKATLILSNSRPKTREVTVNPKVSLQLPLAWKYTTGSRAIKVAVPDDGFFYWHKDIKDNLWHNPGETGTDSAGFPKETNGRDDDSNGYVDDVIGWDFAFNDSDPDPYVFDGMDRNRVQPITHSITWINWSKR